MLGMFLREGGEQTWLNDTLWTVSIMIQKIEIYVLSKFAG